MKRGFTLVELIVVIAIIAILGAVVAPNAFKAVEKSRISAAIGVMNSMKTATKQYYVDVGSWPAANVSTNTGNRLITNVDGNAQWNGPYLDSWPTTNPWGGTYAYYANATMRWVAISGLSATAAGRIDKAVDGAANTTIGLVRYSGTSNITLMYIINSDI